MKNIDKKYTMTNNINMEKLSFYKREDALEAAQDLANENEGSVKSNTIGVNVSDFECPAELGTWSGETSAFIVLDKECNPIAYVAFWEN